jgi:hypothetical protein
VIKAKNVSSLLLQAVAFLHGKEVKKSHASCTGSHEFSLFSLASCENSGIIKITNTEV